MPGPVKRYGNKNLKRKEKEKKIDKHSAVAGTGDKLPTRSPVHFSLVSAAK